MASTTQDELYRKFLEVSGKQSAENADTRLLLTDMVTEFRESQNGAPQTSTTTATQASKAAAADSGGTSVGSVASTVLKSGFGLPALIGGLFGLFAGGDQEAPTPLVKYAMPDSIQFQAAESNSRLRSLDYDQMGMARGYSEGQAGRSTSVSQGQTGQQTSQGSQTPPIQSGHQITVNVQAMDARSFMDRSNDIALAVRDAMLNLNAINDVVNEL